MPVWCIASASTVSSPQFLSKLLEKVVLLQLRSHLLTNSLCDNIQSAYRAHHDKETALVDVTTCPLGGADEGHVSVLTVFDV